MTDREASVKKLLSWQTMFHKKWTQQKVLLFC